MNPTLNKEMFMNYKNLPSVIFDIDGTLADIEHRRIFVSGKKKDFNAFNSAMANDVINVPIVELHTMCHRAGYQIIYCTGRMERDRDVTLEFLKMVHEEGGIIERESFWTFSPDLIMRPDERRSDPDWVVKQDMLNKILEIVDKENIIFTVDDRQKVVDMWRANGLTCLQVAEGNF